MTSTLCLLQTIHHLTKYRRRTNKTSMTSKLRLRHITAPKLAYRQLRKMATSTFTIPFNQAGQEQQQIPVTGPPKDNHQNSQSISQSQLLSFPAFKTWLSSLQKSLALQKAATHEFHKSPYLLRQIDIQAVDYFGAGRLGFVKMKAIVSNDSGESLPGSIFLRGGSVAILVGFMFD
jgi:hypothetical protein